MTGEAEAGRIIGGRYRLVRKLGAGGFGQVWSARDEMLAVDVAVKEVWLPPVMSDAERDERVARAEREARNAAQLRDHPNIVAIHDVVVDGSPWIVMQLVAGRSLQQRIEAEGRLPAEEAARIGGGILKALAAAHAAGIVHRDVKPANILLTGESQGTGDVLLGDFGIAVHQADTALTATGAFVGSIEYVAPERARGDDGLAASDLFSLGATLYQAVEGFSPFHRNTPTGSLTAVLFEQPPPPQRAGVFEPLLAALLAKDPHARPTAQQALEMVENLGTRSGASGSGSGVGAGLGSGFGSGASLGAGAMPTVSAPVAGPGAAPPPLWPGNAAATKPSGSRNLVLAAVGAAVLLAGSGIAWLAGSGGSPSQNSDTGSSQTTSGTHLTGGKPFAGSPRGTSSVSAGGAPSSDQLKKALIADGDITGYSQSQNALDYAVGMYMYQTDGGCAPMDQLATTLDGHHDRDMPRASAGIDVAGQPATTSPLVIGESVEYYGTGEAESLMKSLHDLSTRCQTSFSTKDGYAKPSVIKPITAPGFPDRDVDCVEYDFDPADQPGHNLTVVARVGGTLVTFTFTSVGAPVSNVDPALVTAAVKKAQAAGLPA